MSKNTSTKERILQYLDNKGITKYKFYQETGISNGALSQMKGLSESSIVKILSKYEDLSAEWLLRGEGDMLRSGIVKEHSLVNNVNPGIVVDPEQLYGHLKKAPLIPIDVIRKQKLRVWEYVQRHKELYETFPDNLMPEFDLIHIVRSNAIPVKHEKRKAFLFTLFSSFTSVSMSFLISSIVRNSRLLSVLHLRIFTLSLGGTKLSAFANLMIVANVTLYTSVVDSARLMENDSTMSSRSLFVNFDICVCG